MTSRKGRRRRRIRSSAAHRTRGSVLTDQPDGLVARMRSGDPDAFEAFFNTYERPVYITALAITRDPFLAEEILQDCFVKAYRARHRLRTDRSPLPWLHRVTTNLCYSRIARRRMTMEPITSADQQPRGRPEPRPDQVVESREIIEVLQRGDRLPAPQAADRRDPVLPAWVLAGAGRRDRELQRGHHEVARALRAEGPAIAAAGRAAVPGRRARVQRNEL